MSSSQEHKREAQHQGPVRLGLITVSDTRTKENDRNGMFLQGVGRIAGHQIVAYHLVRDEPEQVMAALDATDTRSAQVVILNGGTGISRRDRTFDVVNTRLDKVLPGFGEIFRMISFEQIGSAAMHSRAVAGVANGQVLISIPGSPAAVELAWEKLILPELPHFAWELLR